jgi:tetratricopeptide (TPR) repeat protein
MVASDPAESHPDSGKLAILVYGNLEKRQAKDVIKHLLRGCPQCAREVAPEAELLLPQNAPRPAGDGGEYESPIERAFDKARLHWRSLKTGQTLAESEAVALSGAPPWAEGERRSQALLLASWKQRYNDPAAMVALASLAAAEAEAKAAMSPVPEPHLSDGLAEAWAELGNAHRVNNNLKEAELSLRHASRYAGQGTGSPAVVARVFDRTASLFTDQRKFREAAELLDRVHAIYREAGDLHLAGRAWISKGTSRSYAEDADQGLRLIGAGLSLIDPRRDPSLVFSAIHTLIDITVRQERFREAQRLLRLSRRLYAEHAGTLNLLKRRWLEGKIAAGLGSPEVAEADFLAVREGFAEHRMPYTVAIVSLDLASLYLRRGSLEETRRLVEETLATFRSLGIRREAIAALLVLHRALERQKATLGLMRLVTARIRRVADGPLQPS